eukprot:m.30486 g.30486  ORF g.30486 m.30486 type:complete len:2380 (+) comp9648_c0_seq1:54-7193(+)
MTASVSWRTWRKHVQLVLWKNYLLKTRAWKGLAVEVLMPTLMFVILVIVRSQVETEQKEAEVSSPLAFSSAGVFVFVQSMLCNGLYDLPTDMGVPVTAPSVMRQLGAGLGNSNVDLPLATGTIAKVLFTSVNTSTPLPPCTHDLVDIMYKGVPTSLPDALVATQCYCEIATSINIVNVTEDIVQRMMKEFVKFPSTSEIEVFLQQEFNVSVTEEEVDNLDNLFVALFPAFTQEPTSSLFQDIFSGNVSDVSALARKLMCPQLLEVPGSTSGSAAAAQQTQISEEFDELNTDFLAMVETIFGGTKIYYAPKNKKTDFIVKHMNRTFQALGVAFDTLKCSAFGASGSSQVSSFDEGLIIERWLHIDGQNVRAMQRDPRYPHHPDMRYLQGLDTVSFHENIGEKFGQVLRGYFRAPATGSYTFWVAGDDQLVLNMSKTSYPQDNEELVAYTWWTNTQRNWFFAPYQQSSPIFMEEGKYYSFSLTNKEGTGEDYGSIAVQVPRNCTSSVPLCTDDRFKEIPVVGEGDMPMKGVAFLPFPLFKEVENSTDGTEVITKYVTSAKMLTDIGYLAMFQTGDPFVGFSNTEDMVRDAMPARKAAEVTGGIEFHNLGVGENENEKEDEKLSEGANNDDVVKLPEQLKYSIRLNPAKTPDTKGRVRKIDSSYGSWTWFLYYYSGFSFIQDMVDRSFMNIHMGYDTTTEIPVMAQKMPIPRYISDDFAPALGPVLPLFMTVAMVYVVSMTVKSIVYEKELKLKETMKLMGISSGVHWTAWFITCIVVTLPSMTIITALLFSGGILRYSDPFLVFVLLEAFVFSSIFLSFLLSTFFSRAKIAAASAGLIFCGFYVPFVFVILHIDELSRGDKLGTALMSTTSFGIATQYIADMEQTGHGLQWSNLFSGYGPCDNFSAGSAVVMVLIDGVVYMLLALYFEAVIPGQFGVPKHPLFFLTWIKQLSLRFFLSNSSVTNGVEGRGDYARLMMDVSDIEDGENSLNASISSTLSSADEGGIVIENLVKDYHQDGCNIKKSKKKPIAVNGLSLRIPPCQVTSLLGSNGAGKSTTISILCGMIPATSGRITVCGKQLSANTMQSVRQHIGVCPQHNTLFDELTVQEHVTFASSVKKLAFGLRKSHVSANTLLKDLGLLQYKHVRSKDLSGGNKRKLSVALAFLETPDIVILDEPTAGMDPGARRASWNLILSLRKSCAVILTTHHLDEADLLSDNVAIMKRGTLRAFGTPLELKEKKGRGYVLTFSLRDSGGDIEAITGLVVDRIVGAKIDHSSPTEISFVLPSVHVEEYPQLFRDIENVRDSLGVESFGVSASKLEDVFLHVTKDSEDDAMDNSEYLRIYEELKELSHHDHHLESLTSLSPSSSTATSVNSTTEDTSDTSIHVPSSIDGPSPHRTKRKLSGHWTKVLKMQILKRFWYTKRDIKTLVSMIILPVVFLSFAMFVAQYTATVRNSPSIEVGVNSYKDACYGSSYFTPFYSYDPAFSSEDFSRVLNCPEGQNTTCPYATSFVDLEDTPEFVDCYDRSLQNRQPDTHGHTSGDGFCYKRNVSNYLVRNNREFSGTHHGAVTAGRQQNMAMTGAEFGTHGTQSTASEGEPNKGAFVRGWFEALDTHSLPSFTNLANNVILKRLTKNPNAHITTFNHPLNASLDTSLKEYIESGTSVSVAIFIIFALSFVPASVLVFLVHERVDKSKHLQLAAGCQRWVYWTASLLWDYASYMVTALLCLLVLVAFDLDGYSGRNLSAVFSLIVLYGLACVPLMYPVSYVFSVPATAYVNMVVLNIFVGITTTLLTFILDALSFEPKLQETNITLKKVFLVFPNYCLGRGILNVVRSEFLTEYEEVLATLYNENSPEFPSPFGWDIAGQALVFLAIQAVVFPLLTLLIEYRRDIKEVMRKCVLFCYKFTTRSKRKSSKRKVATKLLKKLREETSAILAPIEGIRDGDSLKTERVDVFQHPDKFALGVRGLTKIYKRGGIRKKATMAVDRLTFGMRHGECFGLLGVNGAGKSTTFKTITGEQSSTFGDIRVDNISVKHNRMLAQQSSGYCPQFDALLPRLTPTEHLNLFGVLRNLPVKSRPRVVELLLTLLGLDGWKNTPADELSGGNKRKLSLGLALIGNRKVVLLDEPSAGMDAHAKRFLWSRVVNVVETGASVLLTSHSMEECEALCTRVGIMVKGRLHCIGTPQFIKTKYGDGYTLVLKCDASAVVGVQDAVMKAFKGTNLVESHRGYSRFIVPTASSLPLSSTFLTLLQLKEKLGIEHFTFSQTSLEDVFLKFSSPISDEEDGAIEAIHTEEDVDTDEMQSNEDEEMIDNRQNGDFTSGVRRLDSYTLEVNGDEDTEGENDDNDDEDVLLNWTDEMEMNIMHHDNNSFVDSLHDLNEENEA